MQLYKGDAWQQTLRLIAAAGKNWNAQTLVASAGLGLQHIDAEHPSYAVTFAAGHADTVCSTSDTGVWWHGLHRAPRAQSLTDVRGPVLVALSASYARAIHNDLTALGKRSDVDVLLIGGWKDVPGALRVPADRDLRKALGGAVSSLLPRMAQQWLALGEGHSLTSPTTRKRWSEWATASRTKETFERSAMTDEDVLDYIHRLRTTYPSISATAALRRLRDAGFACEQKRFGRLFRDCQEAA